LISVDHQRAVTQLKRAFEFQQNMLSGESIPDPAKDDSFQRFMKNERFLAALTEMKNSGK